MIIIIRKNQVIITALALMIAAAGYYSYAEKNIKGTSVAQNTSDKKTYLTDNGETVLETKSDDIHNKKDTDASEEETILEPGEAVLTSTDAFATNARIDREQQRAQDKETLMEVINNEGLSDEQKEQAVDAMVQITEKSQLEDDVEMLLEAKGFKNVVVNISENSVDVIMDMTDVSDAMRAQIEDLIVRKTNISVENIVITPLN